MYLLKSKLSHLFIMDDNGLMTSKQDKALSFIDEAAGKLYMAKHGFSQEYYELFYSKPNEKDTKDEGFNVKNSSNLSETQEDYTSLLDKLSEKNKHNDLINHPNHYTAYSREVIDTMQGDMTPEEFTGYLKGNIIKYISRYQGKNGVQDLEKAQWYLNKLHDTVKDMKDEQKPKIHPFIKVSADEL